MIRAAIRADGADRDPIDIIAINFETSTAELGGSDFITTGNPEIPGGMHRAGSPRPSQATGGVAPEYVSFFHANNATASLIQNAARWKAQVDLFNRADLGGGPASGADPIVVTSLRVGRIDGFDPPL
jgi:hypothetical protein